MEKRNVPAKERVLAIAEEAIPVQTTPAPAPRTRIAELPPAPRRTRPPTRTLTVRLPSDLMDLLEREKEATGGQMAELVRPVLEAGFAKQPLSTAQTEPETQLFKLVRLGPFVFHVPALKAEPGIQLYRLNANSVFDRFVPVDSVDK